MLCGRRPFEDETKTKVLVLHTSRKPPPLTEWCPGLPDRLSQAVFKGLAKEPAERYPTCVALAKAVAAAAEAAVPRDDRIRLKCPACGKTGSLSAADFAKLKAGGGRANCPACKSPIDLASPDSIAPAAGSGGTMKFSFTGSPADYPVASALRLPRAVPPLLRLRAALHPPVRGTRRLRRSRHAAVPRWQ